MKRWLIDIAVVAAAFIAISAWQGRKLLPKGEEPAPAFTLRDLDGRVVRLADFDGQAVQLHFWGTWCPVCRREHGALNAVANGAGESALLTIAVDSGDAETIRAYAEERGLRYRILVDDGSTAAAYRVTSFPTNYYLDREHRIASRDVGMSTRWGMRVRRSLAARRGGS